MPDPTHTLVESYADGWVWSVPIDANRRAVAAMVDPRTSSITRGEGALATYRHELGKTARMRELLDGAALEGGPAGWDASMYHAARYVGEDWLLAGDAATFVDPLSSAGVKKALASGWLAAIAVHTGVVRPEMGDVALQFFADREADMYGQFLALTRRYLQEAAVGQGQPFWAERAEMREWEEVHVATDGGTSRGSGRLRPVARSAGARGGTRAERSACSAGRRFPAGKSCSSPAW